MQNCYKIVFYLFSEIVLILFIGKIDKKKNIQMTLIDIVQSIV